MGVVRSNWPQKGVGQVMKSTDEGSICTVPTCDVFIQQMNSSQVKMVFSCASTRRQGSSFQRSKQLSAVSQQKAQYVLKK